MVLFHAEVPGLGGGFVGVITMIAAVLLLPPLQARTVIGDGIASGLYVSKSNTPNYLQPPSEHWPTAHSQFGKDG